MGGAEQTNAAARGGGSAHRRDASVIVAATVVAVIALVLVAGSIVLAVAVAAIWGLVVGVVLGGAAGFPRLSDADRFQENAHIEVSRARRSETPLTAAAVEWVGGARERRRFAGRVRQTDTLMRVGSRIHLLLPATTEAQARVLLERIVPEPAHIVRVVSFPDHVLTAAALLDALSGTSVPRTVSAEPSG